MRHETLFLYPGRQDVALTTYLWEQSPELRGSAPRPAVLICPGGGWLACSDREAEPVALRFAAMGYHAFVLKYSTLFAEKPLTSTARQLPESLRGDLCGAAVRDIGAALALICTHTADWAVDPGALILCGFSAGAHLCALYAVGAALPRPSALILGYAPTNFTAAGIGDNPSPFAALTRAALLGSRAPDAGQLQQLSPAQQVTAAAPPAFLWATADDDTVPVQHTLDYAGACARCNVPFELHIFEHGPHGLSLADEASAASRAQISADVGTWVELAARWLRRRFAAALPETVPGMFCSLF